MDNDMLFRVRVYLVDRRLYQVVVFGTREAATSKAVDKFLDSFKLVEGVERLVLPRIVPGTFHFIVRGSLATGNDCPHKFVAAQPAARLPRTIKCS